MKLAHQHLYPTKLLLDGACAQHGMPPRCSQVTNKMKLTSEEVKPQLLKLNLTILRAHQTNLLSPSPSKSHNSLYFHLTLLHHYHNQLALLHLLSESHPGYATLCVGAIHTKEGEIQVLVGELYLAKG
jgi:hypothetical protein